MPLTREIIDNCAELLRSMPRAPAATVNVTKQEAVKELAKEIASVQERGYTLEQIANALRGVGLDLTTPTLKNYLGRVRAGKSRRERPRKPASARSMTRESTRTEPAPAAPTEAPVKSGKEAFLVKDMDSY
jgi:hypothetical protein